MKRSSCILVALCLGAATLTGCETLIKNAPGGRWVPVAPGSTLTLMEPIRIPAGRTRIFFVNGRLSTASGSYRPVCALEVRRIDRQRVQTIAPVQLRISRIQNYWTEVVAAEPAGAVRFRLVGHDSDGGYSMIRTGFHFWLDEDGSGPMRLTCLGVLADPADADPPTLEEIRQALGDLAAIDISAGSR